MSDTTTRRLIDAYAQGAADPVMFLTGFFQSPAVNFYNSEEVEIDIIRDDEDIAIVLEDISQGYRLNTNDLYTNKSFKPPAYKEAVPINSFDLIKRMPGQDPFQNPDYRSAVITRMFSAMTLVERKIRRALELQAAQILQTGRLTLRDSAGNSLFTMNFSPKTTHFPTVTTAWTASGSTPLADLNSLAEVIRNDGLTDPDQLIMGIDAYNAFIEHQDVQDALDNRRMDRGAIVPIENRGGANYRGTIDIGNYPFDIWTYGARYKDPQTNAKTQYIATDKVIMRASSGRMDATFGAIPNIGQLVGAQNAAAALLPELPGRFSNQAGGMDLFTNAWLTNDGEQLMAGIGARPLLIPTAIDTFGCLDVSP